MLHFSSGRLSEIRSLTANLEAQRDEATRQGREAQTQREIRAAQDRLRTVQRSSEDLRGELERMRIANTSARISTRDALPSFQGQPASSSRQSHRKTANSSNTGSTSAPQGSREASRTTHNPDVRPSTTLEARSSRQQHHRASRSEDVPQGNLSNYGQPTAYQPGASSGQGFGQATGTQPFSDYQPPSGLQQNVVPQAPSFQAPPIQQPSYYRGYTSSDIAPSLTRTSRQGDSTDSTESSDDEYVDDRGSPYRVNRRQFRDVAGVSVRRNTEAAPGHRSNHRSASGSGGYEPTAIPSQGTGRPSSSSHRRSSSNASNTAAGSSRLPPIGGSTLPGPAVGLPRQTAAPIPPYQSYRPSSPLPQTSQQLAPEYRFPPPNPSSRSYPAHSQSGPTDNRYPTGRAPPNAGTMTAQMQQLSFNQYNQQSAPMGQGSASWSASKQSKYKGQRLPEQRPATDVHAASRSSHYVKLAYVSRQLSANTNPQKGCKPRPFRTSSSASWYPTTIRDITAAWRSQFDCRPVNVPNRSYPAAYWAKRKGYEPTEIWALWYVGPGA
ncbi:hypothetical protein NOF04DRAFT_6842 [Fusarium oxysporum II5]|uniref:Uncharacterized protein n=1 Tax=Fusarium odoratissimum (strain NRRL 54006) TaxID=1089451 RepID=X0JMK5_FUSO5|nr:uncharacterized protein FOIG_09976 [Fusarium odoratissimum NRRL 54006]EXL97651.1 hypothetical protein FOIG_09976 [Fusarium odoratissimum NRRL 54006]KAK2122626.1 hypothetical protein NOF04DRAFT_6842 [Fusarium oxysporum II5]